MSARGNWSGMTIALASTLALTLACGLAAQDASRAAEPTESSHGDPSAGRKSLLEKGCLRCHSILGKGGVSAPDLAKLGGTYTYFQLIGLMWGHSPKMMETAHSMGLTWPNFEPSEMEDITAYLHSAGETQELGNPAAGERIFGRVCVLCHEVGGHGASVGPALDFLARNPSGVEMAMAMWNHGIGMTSTMKVKGVSRPVLGEEDVAHLMAYIRARSRDTSSVRYSPMGDPAAGQQVFVKAGCATCHGPGGRGDIGPDLAAAGPRGVARIAAKLWNHAPAMIEMMKRTKIDVPMLDIRQTGDLMAFLGFLGYVDARPDLVAGKALYEEKGCIECHGHPGKKDGTGPDLAGIEALKTRSGVASAMWNHAPAMAAALGNKRSQLSWPRFIGDQMRDLVGYLRHIASGGGPIQETPSPAPSAMTSPSALPSATPSVVPSPAPAPSATPSSKPPSHAGPRDTPSAKPSRKHPRGLSRRKAH